jgi:thioredoxin reductase (NADPH)
VISAYGEDRPERIEALVHASIEIEDILSYEADALFVIISAATNTSWLPGELERDARGYICTGCELTTWKLARQPFPLEISLPGVFCAGDIRLQTSIKRSRRRQYGHRFYPSIPCFARRTLRERGGGGG